MASTIISSMPILVLSTIVVAMATSTSHHESKETQMSMYLHDFVGTGSNFTDIPVVGVAGQLWRYDQFGTIYVNDDLATEGPSRESRAIGRAQGFTVTTSLDGRNALSVVYIMFTNKKYNGSTIQIQGDYKQYVPSLTELGVVSGTGKFRFARGYATFETISFDVSSGYSVTRCNVTVQHY